MAAIQLADCAGVVIDRAHVGVELQITAQAFGHTHQAVVVALEREEGHFDRCQMGLEVQYRAVEFIHHRLGDAPQFFADLDTFGAGHIEQLLDFGQAIAQITADGVGLGSDGVALLGADFFVAADRFAEGVKGGLYRLDLVTGRCFDHLLVVGL